MTSQPQPTPGSATQYLRPLRDIAAYVLVAAPAAVLFVAIIRLIPSGVGLDFGSRAQDSFDGFVNVATIFFPLGAVLLALLVTPRHPRAKLITVIAAVEYAVAAVFAIVFGVLVGLVKIASSSARTAFEELLLRAAWLAVFAVAGFATYQIWRHLFYTPKPKREPGVYGQPQYRGPATYPGQSGYGLPGAPAGGQPAAAPHGYGQPGPAGQPGQAGFGQPPFVPAGQPPYGPEYGQPQHGQPQYGQPQYGQPQHGVPGGYPGQPASAPPAPATTQPFSTPPATTPPFTSQPAATQPLPAEPTSGTPASTYPPRPEEPAGGYSPFTEPTQVVPRTTGPGREPAEADRTQIVGDDRPGYGGASEDPRR